MFSINLKSRNYIYEQIIEQVENGVLKGFLKEEEQLPSVRALSLELTVNPNTVSKAYAELERRGVIYSLSGKGCYIKSDAIKSISEKLEKGFDEFYKNVENYRHAGIGKEKLIEIIEKVYGGEEK